MTRLLTAAVVAAFIGTVCVTAQSADVAAADKASCDAAHRPNGKLDLAGYLKCRDDRDREREKAAADATAKTQRDELSEAKAAVDKGTATRLQRELVTKRTCEDANRGRDGKVDIAGYVKCADEMDRAAEQAAQAARDKQAAAFAAQLADEKKQQEAAQAAADETFRREDAARQANADRMRAEYERATEEARLEDEALQRKCGDDYQRVAVGMPWARAKECAGPFTVRASDEGGVTVYENSFAFVRVQNGKITRFISK